MLSINSVTLVGRAGRDGEVRSTASGAKVGSLSIATERRYKDKDTGEWKSFTTWHNLVTWDKYMAEILGAVKKGDKVTVANGEIRQRKWQDQNGNDRWAFEIMLGYESCLSAEAAEIAVRDARQGGSTGRGHEPPPPGDLDDDIPF